MARGDAPFRNPGVPDVEKEAALEGWVLVRRSGPAQRNEPRPKVPG